MSVTDTPGEVLDPALEARGTELRSAEQGRLFRTVWRWHFYAGLLVIPVLVILCLSGIVYLFKPQIDAIAYGNLRDVTPSASGTTVSYDRQRDAAQRYLGDEGLVLGMTPLAARDRATEFEAFDADGRDVTVYVNPYSGKVTGSRDDGATLTALALELHGTLLSARLFDDEGKWGDRVIELAASWTVVLLITGMYLWWPRGRKRTWRTALQRPRGSRDRRTFWRDLHATTAVLFSFVFLFFLVTGLAWTGVWGERATSFATDRSLSYPAGTYDGAESKTIEDITQGRPAAWSMGKLPVLRSPSADGDRTLRWNPADGAPLDAIVGQAESMGLADGYVVSFPEDSAGAYTLTAMPDGDAQPNVKATDQRVTYIDQYTAEPISDYEYAEFGIYAKTMDLGIALHEGRQFGLVNQLLTLMATLALLLTMATSVVMWRKRRPRGIGAPRRPADRRLGIGVLAITAGLGVFLPLLGLSLIALILLDLLVIRRIPPLRRALGA